MAGYKIFIDGEAGTTGLRIKKRLSNEPDIELLSLPDSERKLLSARAALAQQADLTFLCLPDDAAKELVQAVSPQTVIIDTSTAHRTQQEWAYGFAELEDNETKIKTSNRIAVPGCYATGFLAIAAPLAHKQIVPASYPYVFHAFSGYSGAGKAGIAQYENVNRPKEYTFPREYALTLNHKHLPEMKKYALLTNNPVFSPVICDYYSGMMVSVPVLPALIQQKEITAQQVALQLQTYYKDKPLITVHNYGEKPADNMLASGVMSGKDSLEIFILGNEEQILLVSRFDNLGKGASGAAIQCMNLRLGRKQTAGLIL